MLGKPRSIHACARQALETFQPWWTRSPLPWFACSGTSSRCTGQVEGGRQIQATEDPAKLIIYRALVETELDAPKYLVRDTHEAYVQAIAGFEACTR